MNNVVIAGNSYEYVETQLRQIHGIEVKAFRDFEHLSNSNDLYLAKIENILVAGSNIDPIVNSSILQELKLDRTLNPNKIVCLTEERHISFDFFTLVLEAHFSEETDWSIKKLKTLNDKTIIDKSLDLFK